MEIGVSMFGDLQWDQKHNRFGLAQERLKQMVEQVVLMDQLKLDVFGVGEHHRDDYAVSVPEIVLATLAGLTHHIKLTSSVSVLSSSDPVRLFQSFTTVNQLSDQRCEMTVGRGSFTESFPVYGYDLEHYQALFNEKLELLLKLNHTHGPVDWQGKHRASLHHQTIYPQSEAPLDIWIAAGGTPESVERAAKLGLPLIFAIIGGNPMAYKPYFDYYKQVYIASGHDVNKMKLATHSHGLLADNTHDITQSYFGNYKAQMDRIGATRGWQPYTLEQFQGGMDREGALFVGEVNQVVDKILYHQELFGLTRWVMHMDVGAPSHLQIMRSIELLGDKVAPLVKKALQK